MTNPVSFVTGGGLGAFVGAQRRPLFASSKMGFWKRRWILDANPALLPT